MIDDPSSQGASPPDSAIDQLKREQFAHLYGAGTPIPEALEIAGFTSKSLALGFKLLHDPAIIALVDQARQWCAEKLAINKTTIIEQLQRDREFAYRANNPSAAIAASSMIAKIIGASDPTTRTPSKITISWEDEETAEPDLSITSEPGNSKPTVEIQPPF